MKYFAITLLLLSGFTIVGCAPEVGSEKWCENMKEKPKGDWTMSETGDYAKHCVL